MLPREIFRVFTFESRKSVHSEPKITKDYTVLEYNFINDLLQGACIEKKNPGERRSREGGGNRVALP